MEELDSRALRYVNCFVHTFSRPGRVHYDLTTMVGRWLPIGEQGFTIEVGDADTAAPDGRHHDVVVTRAGERFVANPPALTINAGDRVVWHAPDALTPGFVVHGEGPDGSFDSAALTNRSVYTHAFGQPGEYAWIDANGGRVRGMVEVQAVAPQSQDEFAAWLKSLETPALVRIVGEEASPERVQITQGQSVFWSVEQAPRISITDARLARTVKAAGNAG